EHWISAWERYAEANGVERLNAAFWTAGDVWIAARRAARN
ncbi:MAG: hypothetical protein QOJ75_736, partial [Chloroflexota bacterium]|nr:hypothetical protein [Chloroflexota bacterium]